MKKVKWNQLKSGDWVLAYTVSKLEPTRIRLYDRKPGFDGGLMIYAYHPHFPQGHEWGMYYPELEAPIIRKMTSAEIASIPPEVIKESNSIGGEEIDYTKDLVSC